jgi:hypothetical protein
MQRRDCKPRRPAPPSRSSRGSAALHSDSHLLPAALAPSRPTPPSPSQARSSAAEPRRPPAASSSSPRASALARVALTPGSGRRSPTFTAVAQQPGSRSRERTSSPSSTPGDAHITRRRSSHLSSGGSLANPLSDFTLVPDTTIVPVSVSGGASSGNRHHQPFASVNGFNGAVDLSCAGHEPRSPAPSRHNSSVA